MAPDTIVAEAALKDHSKKKNGYETVFLKSSFQSNVQRDWSYIRGDSRERKVLATDERVFAPISKGKRKADKPPPKCAHTCI